MTKAILSFGWTNYVLEVKDAVLIAELMGKAEKYEEKYVASGKPNSHHIYETPNEAFGHIKLISDELYRMAKLAGPPARD